ncbi:MAG: hypothetical protein PF574_05055 [Candidatus Delongbacteria bacterium]|jgi:hypothetical protein|nr:hypothetical protein [Candidatus Delongbacteria bacterium]
MKVKLIIWALILIWFISCSVPSDPTDTLTLENYKINIVFDRETFAFDTLNLKVELDPIAFPESLKVAPIRDSTSQDFNDFVVEGGMKSKYVQYADGAPFSIGTIIPEGSYIDSIVNIPDNAQFLWAQTDSMRVNFSVDNNYNELNFDSLNIVILRKDVMYTGMPSYLNGYRVIVDTTFFDFQHGTTKLDSMLLDKAWITDGMTLKLTAYNQGLTLTQPLDATQNLYFNVIVDDSKFHRAFANFNAQVDNQTDTYSRGDITEYGNIKLRSIILKDAQLSVDAKNETDLFVEIDGQIDNFYDLKKGVDSLVSVDKFAILPRSDSLDIIEPVLLDSCKFTVNYENQSATVTHDSWGRALPGSPDDPYVLLTQNDSVSFYFEIESSGEALDYVPFYEFDGLVENETIQISETTSGFTEDIDWDDWNGVTLNSMNLKIAASFERDDLFMQDLILDGFQMRGTKTDGTPPTDWVLLEGYALSNFNSDTLLISEDSSSPAQFESIINYQPDAIEYSANATMTFDGKLMYDDKLNLELLVGTALEITITDEFVKEMEVHERDSLEINEGSEVINMKINSKINNPRDESDRNALITFSVYLADDVIYDADSVQVLAGNIIQLVSMDITPNPDGFPDGYFLTDINEGPDMDEGGIYLEEDAINMMIEKKTYMQEVITIKPEIPGGEVYLGEEGFIDVQTTISGEFNVSIGGSK